MADYIGVTAPKRSLADTIRDPSPLGLIMAVLIAFIPLAWPLTLYVVVRYLTGHRAPKATANVGPSRPD